MAPAVSSPAKNRRGEVSRMGPQEEWTAVLRRPAKTKTPTVQPRTIPGSGPAAPAVSSKNRGMLAAQVGSHDVRLGTAKGRIAPGRPAQDLPRGVLSQTEMDSRISQLREMGFSEQAARDALGEVFWNLNAALDLLFTRGSPMTSPGSTDTASILVSSVADKVDAVNADADTLSASTRSQPDTDPETARFPCARGISSSGSSENGSEEHSVIHETPCENSIYFAGPEEEPSLPNESSGRQALEVEALEVEAIAQSTSSRSNGVSEDIPVVSQEAAIHHQSHRPLYRVKETWVETDASQVGMRAGGVVRMWPGTETQLGWVYVEEVGGQKRAGWMPTQVLGAVQDGYVAVRAVSSCGARFENQLSVQEGLMFLVDIRSRTDEGWAYGETVESPETTTGWVPIMCLEWPEL